MGLRAIANSDLAAILEDADGFTWPITITDPDGTVGGLYGFSNDIAQTIDIDTGAIISGRAASIAIRIGALTSAGLGMPRGIASTTARPWIVSFDDIEGVAHKFKVVESNPDRSLGLVTCRLEGYIDA